MNKIKAFYRKWHTYCPLFTMVMVHLLPIVLLCHVLAIALPAFANFLNQYPAAALRFLLAKITGILPFSLAEILLILAIPLAILAIVLAVRIARKPDPKPSWHMLFSLVGGLLLLYVFFVFTLGTAYFTTPIHEEMELDRQKVTAQELFDTASVLLDNADEWMDDVTFDESGASVMPYDIDELNEKLNQTYQRLGKEYDFLAALSSNVKPVLLSEPMTYTHISGVYTFFTGEANLNVNFPDSTLPHTMAHEMAHQRGVAREDEANFVAFLVCIETDDPYIRYSGYVETFKYFVNALASADTELFKQIYAIADERIVGEIVAFNKFFEKYKDNTAATVSGAINDAYQQLQGVEEGSKSYGLVVDLTVAYYKKNK